MVKVSDRNVNMNLHFCIKAVVLLLSAIVVDKLSVKFHFRKLGKDLKCLINVNGNILSKNLVNEIYQ